MNKKWWQGLGVGAVLLMLILGVVMGGNALAVNDCAGVSTILIDCESGNTAEAMFEMLGKVINGLLVGVGVLAAIGLAVAGVRYLVAGGNVQVTVVAKMQVWQVVVGLVIYVLLFVGVNLLLPSGYGVEAPEFVANLSSYDTTPHRSTSGGGGLSGGQNRNGRGDLLAQGYYEETHDVVTDDDGNPVLDSEGNEVWAYNDSMGSAGTLNDNTVVVTVYGQSGDTRCGDSWAGVNHAADISRLGIATGWIQNQLTGLGVSGVDLIYHDGSDERLQDTLNIDSSKRICYGMLADTSGNVADVSVAELVGYARNSFTSGNTADASEYVSMAITVPTYGWLSVWDDVLNHLMLAYPATTPVAGAEPAGYKASIEELKADYNADNVVFLLEVKGIGRSFAMPVSSTCYGNFGRCEEGTFGSGCTDTANCYPYEVTTVFVDGQCQGLLSWMSAYSTSCASSEVWERSTMAHEILHLFGAADLYCEGNETGAAYCADNSPRLQNAYYNRRNCWPDIMGVNYDVTGVNTGTSEITECTLEFLD